MSTNGQRSGDVTADIIADVMREGTPCPVSLFDLLLRSLVAPDLVYHWSNMDRAMVVNGRTYTPAPIEKIEMERSRSVIECAQDVTGRVVVFSPELSCEWYKGEYQYAEFVDTMAFLRKDNRVTVMPREHYEWQGQWYSFQFPRTVLLFARNTADGARCAFTGAYRPRLNMQMGELW